MPEPDDGTVVLCSRLAALADAFAAGPRHWSLLREMGRVVADLTDRHIEERETAWRKAAAERLNEPTGDQVGREAWAWTE